MSTQKSEARPINPRMLVELDAALLQVRARAVMQFLTSVDEGVSFEKCIDGVLEELQEGIAYHRKAVSDENTLDVEAHMRVLDHVLEAAAMLTQAMFFGRVGQGGGSFISGELIPKFWTEVDYRVAVGLFDNLQYRRDDTTHVLNGLPQLLASMHIDITCPNKCCRPRVYAVAKVFGVENDEINKIINNYAALRGLRLVVDNDGEKPAIN